MSVAHGSFAAEHARPCLTSNRGVVLPWFALLKTCAISLRPPDLTILTKVSKKLWPGRVSAVFLIPASRATSANRRSAPHRRAVSCLLPDPHRCSHVRHRIMPARSTDVEREWADPLSVIVAGRKGGGWVLCVDAHPNATGVHGLTGGQSRSNACGAPCGKAPQRSPRAHCAVLEAVVRFGRSRSLKWAVPSFGNWRTRPSLAYTLCLRSLAMSD